VVEKDHPPDPDKEVALIAAIAFEDGVTTGRSALVCRHSRTRPPWLVVPVAPHRSGVTPGFDLILAEEHQVGVTPGREGPSHVPRC
jgi:hypothetical protein